MKRIIIAILTLGASIFVMFGETLPLDSCLRGIVSRYKAEVGVAVIVDGKDTVTVNNSVHYPMMSVFKFHQALAVADYMERNNLPLGTLLFVPESELKKGTYSPLRDRYPHQPIVISVAELLNYTLQLSDNNACDLLFRHVIGVSKTDEYIRSLGIEDCQIIADEEMMGKDKSLCYENWSTPLATAELLDVLSSGKILGEEYRDFIVRTMVECGTGKDRIVKALEGTGALCGHKTGTGPVNEKGQIIGVNDVGFVWLPNGKRYSIAVFVKDSQETLDNSSKIIAEISEAVYKFLKD